MLKGTVTFETFNKNGELIQRESAENMVTDAIDGILSLSPWFTDSINNKLPIAQKLLGGLYLFDGQLTAQASNTTFPGRNAKLVGMGGRMTDNQDPVRGTYDDSVSGPVENGFKSVWKFTEDQANGDIKSVALTSVNAGTGFNLVSTGSTHIDAMNTFNSTYGFIDDTLSKIAWPLIYDDETQTMYYAVRAASSPFAVSVYKRRIPIYSFGVNDGGNPGNIDLVYPRELVGTFIDSTSSSFNCPKYSSPNYDGYMYFWTDANYNASATQLQFKNLIKLDLNALKQGNIVTTQYGTYNSQSGKYELNFDVIAPTSSMNIRFTINNDCLYVGNCGEADYDIQRIPFWIENNETVIGTRVKYPSTKNSVEKTNYLISLPNGVVAEAVYVSSGNRYVNLLYDDPLPSGASELPDSSFIRIPTGLTSDWESRHHKIGMVDYVFNNNADVYAFPYEQYLGTIFNLPNTVQKTSDKTMTVTYTLTNVPINS